MDSDFRNSPNKCKEEFSIGFALQNTETKKFLFEKQGPVKLTVKSKESATVFNTEVEASKAASNFETYELIKV